MGIFEMTWFFIKCAIAIALGSVAIYGIFWLSFKALIWAGELIKKIKELIKEKKNKQ